MHIEPGIVNGAKMLLSFGTASVAGVTALKYGYGELKKRNFLSVIPKSIMAMLMVFGSFEVLPHFSAGVSEVHLILGTTLFLLFGVFPAAIGLAGGLLLQSLFFAPTDLPMYFVNVSTLLFPLFALAYAGKRIIPENTPYVEIKYAQAMKLSLTYQAGIVSWVGFWAFYGQGFTAETLSGVGTFGIAYLSVILVEPMVDLGVLAIVKQWSVKSPLLFTDRLHAPAESGI